MKIAKIFKFDRILCLAWVIVLSLNLLFVGYSNAMLKATNENELLKSKIVKLEREVNLSRSRLRKLSSEYISMVSSKNEEVSKTQLKLEDSLDIINKYEPIMNHILKYKTKDSYISLAFVKSLMYLCETKNINPYVVLAIIDVESQFDKNYVNGSQIGLMQISEPTARWIHYSLLHRTVEYDHGMLSDNMMNVSYGVAYIVFMNEKYNGDYNKILKEYCGGYSKKYMADNYYENVFKQEIIQSMKLMGLSSENIRMIFQPFSEKNSVE